MLYDNVYVKPMQGYSILLILFGVFMALAILLLIFFLVAIHSLRRQSLSPSARKSGKSATPCAAVDNVKYTKVESEVGFELILLKSHPESEARPSEASVRASRLLVQTEA